MESLLNGLSQHGYLILFGAVFLESIGIPVPSALALLIAGAAAGRGALVPWLTAASALSAFLLGDSILFLLGRHTGWWLLGVLCRLSLNPESCILSAADSFYRRGRVLLLFAKFVPGINTMAAPLAGSMNMRFLQFLGLDSIGVSLYVGAYFSVGFLFSGAIEALTRGYHAFSHMLSLILIAALLGYATVQVRAWMKARGLRSVPFVSPAEAAGAVSSAGAMIYDVRSHGYYDLKATRVKGSRRLDPNALHRPESDIAPAGPIFLYCTCLQEATSVRVARELLGKGIPVAVIKGGLGAWKKAGLPIEAVPQEEISPLPTFESEGVVRDSMWLWRRRKPGSK
jgi:membrane protein DedA with SNARE-associated domain/rhodanese-related sulfurtransferase